MANVQADLIDKGGKGRLMDLYLPIREDLRRVEEILDEEVRSSEPYINTLARHASQFSGKRIRPGLLLHAANLCGTVTEKHRRLSAVVELLHNATLIHDDVLDESEKRRNVPTVHMNWGNEASILFGDYLFSRAFTLCAQLEDPAATTLLAEATQNTCIGEMIQVSAKFQWDIDEEFYLRMIGLKTASLFSASCQLGTLQESPVPEEWRESLGNYGRHLGTAFQIVDDCLDIVGDERETGKSLGTDLGKGKWTLPLIVLLRQATSAQKKELEYCLTTPGPVAEKKKYVSDLVYKHGILDAVFQRARDCAEAARSELKRLRGNDKVDYLHQIVDFVIDRRG